MQMCMWERVCVRVYAFLCALVANSALSQAIAPRHTCRHAHAEAEADISPSVSLHMRNADTVNRGRLAGTVSISIIISIIRSIEDPDQQQKWLRRLNPQLGGRPRRPDLRTILDSFHCVLLFCFLVRQFRTQPGFEKISPHAQITASTDTAW